MQQSWNIKKPDKCLFSIKSISGCYGLFEKGICIVTILLLYSIIVNIIIIIAVIIAIIVAISSIIAIIIIIIMIIIYFLSLLSKK